MGLAGYVQPADVTHSKHNWEPASPLDDPDQTFPDTWSECVMALATKIVVGRRFSNNLIVSNVTLPVCGQQLHCSLAPRFSGRENRVRAGLPRQSRLSGPSPLLTGKCSSVCSGVSSDLNLAATATLTDVRNRQVQGILEKRSD